jgi:hypothetical protein
MASLLRADTCAVGVSIHLASVVRRQKAGKRSGKGHSGGPLDWLCDSCIEGRVRVVRNPEQQQAAIQRLAAMRQARAAALASALA